ncbi:hypothetical protein B0H11DRAFT_2104355, partial [Mycena galericulata]
CASGSPIGFLTLCLCVLVQSCMNLYRLKQDSRPLILVGNSTRPRNMVTLTYPNAFWGSFLEFFIFYFFTQRSQYPKIS